MVLGKRENNSKMDYINLHSLSIIEPHTAAIAPIVIAGGDQSRRQISSVQVHSNMAISSFPMPFQYITTYHPVCRLQPAARHHNGRRRRVDTKTEAIENEPCRRQKALFTLRRALIGNWKFNLFESFSSWLGSSPSGLMSSGSAACGLIQLYRLWKRIQNGSTTWSGN